MSAGGDPSKGRPLRMPAALAVAFVASSAAVSLWYSGCDAGGPEPPIPDAGRLGMAKDARQLDAAELADAGDLADAAIEDAAVDAATRDAAAPDTPVR